EWYFDGQVLHVTPSQASVSRLLTLNVVSFQRLVDGLRALEIYDDRFPIKPTPGADVALVTGPPRFVGLVENAMTALAETRPTLNVAPAVQTSLASQPIKPLVIYRGSNVQILRGEPVPSQSETDKNNSE
ncbi:MAG: hypothetical protein AAGE61_13425, partial [Pseudomonadota bacterium]